MKDLSYNKRATFDYELLDRFEAGIKLLGSEVKSVRAGNMSLKGAFVTFSGAEVQLTNALVPAWQPKNTADEYDPIRSRQLLLHEHELNQLRQAKQEQGLTVIPIRVYSKRGVIKVEIALARGKKQYSKKEAKKQQALKLHPETCVSIGNGLIDLELMKVVKLRIVTLQAEGVHVQTLLNSDIVIPSINDALDLLLDPSRLIATLRK